MDIQEVTSEQVEADQTVQAGVESQSGGEPAAEESQQEMVVSIGEDPAQDTEAEEERKAPAWVKKLRQHNRELERKTKELERKLAAVEQKAPELGKKPALMDYDFDADKYEQALESWYDRKRKHDEMAQAAEAETKTAEQRWQGKFAQYQQAKASFIAPDFAESEAVVLDLLDSAQQSIIVSGAADPAMVVYALGKNEAKAKELAAIKDLVEFAFAIARLEGQVKVTKRPATAPEGKVIGSGRSSGGVDQTLARLREEAAKSGDYSKVHAYKRGTRS